MNDKFQLACDQLSNTVDDVQFERMRWARDEGPKLARLVELAQGAVESREDFELNEEGATSTSKRFVIKIHSKRIAAVSVALDSGRAVVAVEPIERSAYSVAPGQPVTEDFTNVDDQWMANALSELFGRIRAAE